MSTLVSFPAVPPVTESSGQSHVPVQEPSPQFTATCCAPLLTENEFSAPVNEMSEMMTPVPGVPRVSG